MVGRASIGLAGLVLATATVGCGRGDTPQLGRVSGIVTLDGIPLTGACVQFIPERGRPSTSRTDATGHYRPIYIRGIEGVCLGPCTVSISTARVEQPADSPEGLPVAASPETLPARYHSETVLRADVKPGTNVVDFALESTP